MSDYYIKDIRAYAYSKGPLWIGWIVINREMKPIYWLDNRTKYTIEPETNMAYVTFGFSQKQVIDKLTKVANDLVEKAKKEEKDDSKSSK